MGFLAPSINPRLGEVLIASLQVAHMFEPIISEQPHAKQPQLMDSIPPPADAGEALVHQPQLVSVPIFSPLPQEKTNDWHPAKLEYVPEMEANSLRENLITLKTGGH